MTINAILNTVALIAISLSGFYTGKYLWDKIQCKLYQKNLQKADRIGKTLRCRLLRHRPSGRVGIPVSITIRPHPLLFQIKPKFMAVMVFDKMEAAAIGENRELALIFSVLNQDEMVLVSDLAPALPEEIEQWNKSV